MKLNRSTLTAQQIEDKFDAGQARFMDKAVIPVICPKRKELEAGKHEKRKCHVDPADTDSAMCEVSIPHFSAGTPEEFLHWDKTFSKMCQVHFHSSVTSR